MKVVSSAIALGGWATHVALDEAGKVLVIHDNLRHVVIEFGELTLTLVEIATEMESGRAHVVVLHELMRVVFASGFVYSLISLHLHVFFEMNSLVCKIFEFILSATR